MITTPDPADKSVAAAKARGGRCECGCPRVLHCGPTWPAANGACIGCPKGCLAYVEWGSLPSHTQIKPPAGTVVRIEGEG